MWRLTRCCVAVILVCEIVAALEDPYILLTKRLNKIERNVNENFEDFRAEITTMLDIIKGINSSVFDLKKMFVNKMANDSYAKHTEPVNATHLMSIHNGFRAEKKARVQLTYDLNRILLSLQKHNSSVDAKLGTLERNLTDVVRRMVANSISLIKMQENFESKQKSVEDNVREHNQYFHGLLQDHNSSVSAKLGTLERNLTDAVRTMAANRMSLTKMQENFESKQKSVEDSVRELTAGSSSEEKK